MVRKAGKILYVALGTICVGLGVLGIILPLMPTTVFLLMAAFFYSRSSDRFNDWLHNNRIFGEYITNYREGRGMTARHKTRAIILLWVTIGLSVWFVDLIAVRVVLFLVAAGVSTFLLRFVPTYRPDEPRHDRAHTSVAPAE